MRLWFRKRLGRFYGDDRGSLVLESSLTMPLMVLFTLLLMGLGITAYYRTMLIHSAYEWSERAAYVWKDSHKDPVTGAFVYGEQDGIYSQLLTEGFGFLTTLGNGMNQSRIELPAKEAFGSQVQRAKLLRSTRQAAGYVGGQGYYLNRLVEGELRAAWEGKTSIPGLLFLTASGRKAEASSYYSDPVELLRNTALVKEYMEVLIQRFSSPREAAERLPVQKDATAERAPIRSERQAAAYIQQLIGGSPTKLSTSLGERQIDVLDRDQVAHEAKYTVNKTDAMVQLQKDAELIRTGQLKGVVWHFFPLERTGKWDITEKLRKALEESGIVVVLHP